MVLISWRTNPGTFTKHLFAYRNDGGGDDVPKYQGRRSGAPPNAKNVTNDGERRPRPA
jgi:hypothetical protein